ncbi:uncharacterized protein LOC126837280 [Adelges cooleyi]|uniref:uncharacterized protein LOC126837280 n=1 Tax=Adelges cooleyi TaxID=133065 RepID=UPI0021801543|nr:uncharacterized protein LOC126837280 [Adelges cooleyi]
MIIITLYFVINLSTFKSQPVNDVSPFWLDPCGTQNDEDTVLPDDVRQRVLIVAERNQQYFNQFKNQFVQNLVDNEFIKHYNTWSNLNNSWMPDDLPKIPGDHLSNSWLSKRSFPQELPITYDILQRVSVGFEKLTDDTKKNNSYFEELSTCKKYLRELLCEVKDAIYDMEQEPLPDVQREVMPDDVRHEEDEGRNNLLNSIIFRDYIIGIEYVIQTYRSFKLSDFMLQTLKFIIKILKIRVRF